MTSAAHTQSRAGSAATVLIHLVVGEEKSPVSITFRYDGSEGISISDALVLALTGMVWYRPQAGEQS